MAGTGHQYEILNPSDLDDFVDVLISKVATDESRRWLTSRHFRRFLTGTDFVSVPLENEARRRIDCYPDMAIRPVLEDKFEQCLVRVFNPDRAAGTLHDPHHLADYLAEAERDPKARRALAHASVDATAEKARAWTHAAWKKARADQAVLETTPFLPSAENRYWVRLDGPLALSLEGRAMSHCVGQQAELMQSRGSVFYSLRGRHRRPLLTLREDAGKDVRLLGEVRGFANNAHLPWYAEDIVLLAGHVGMRLAPHASRSLRSFAVECGVDGKWSLMANSMVPFPIPGAHALADGDRLVLLGSGDAAVMTIHGPQDWMHQEHHEGIVLHVEIKEDVPHDDRIAAATVIDRFRTADLRGIPDFMVQVDGRWMDWTSTAQHSMLEGMPLRTRDDTVEIHVDDRGAMAVVTHQANAGRSATVEFLRDTTDADALFRLAKVLDSIGCVPSYQDSSQTETKKEATRSFHAAGLQHVSRHSRWIHRPSETVRQKVRKGNTVSLFATPFDLVAKSDSDKLKVEFDTEGRAVRISVGISTNGSHAEETSAIVAWMNAKGMSPSPELSYDDFSFEISLRRGRPCCVPVWNGHSWRSANLSSRSPKLTAMLMVQRLGTTGLSVLVARSFLPSPYMFRREKIRSPDPRLVAVATLRLVEKGGYLPSDVRFADLVAPAVEGLELLTAKEAVSSARRVADVLEERSKHQGYCAWSDFGIFAPLAAAAAVHLSESRYMRLMKRISGYRRGRSVYLMGLDPAHPRIDETTAWLMRCSASETKAEDAAIATNILCETLRSSTFEKCAARPASLYVATAEGAILKGTRYSYLRTKVVAALSALSDDADCDPDARVRIRSILDELRRMDEEEKAREVAHQARWKEWDLRYSAAAGRDVSSAM